MNVGASLVANPQAAELVQPTQSPFDDPSVDTQTTAVFRVASSDGGCDAAAPQQHAVTMRVVDGAARVSPSQAGWRRPRG